MEPLTHGLRLVGLLNEPGCHGLDTLAISVEKQAGEVAPEGATPLSAAPSHRHRVESRYSVSSTSSLRSCAGVSHAPSPEGCNARFMRPGSISQKSPIPLAG